MLWLTVMLTIISFGVIAVIQKQLIHEKASQAQYPKHTLPVEDCTSDSKTDLYVDS